ncbi:ornithine racemase Orr [Clostridium algidicarnis]|uniref:Alanine/ornithine racemase family PLP-dependent enzyme n=1 Tax=Clostridium algidicarnis TaxID=37659 RepID=A0ABS6C2B8_9CLOT|nr:ornithine racemase Orr [Clostridium algidicarnis]MBU3219608.1 alanine/ornithine racemase family PLP-dependent enzyme [Clostridium algidicarnis]
MIQEYPCIEVNLDKIAHNTREIIKVCKKEDIETVIVTKVFCAEKSIVKTIIDEGIKTIGDSRIKNLINVKEFNCKKMLLRIPMISEALNVVKYSDVSLNSELEVMKSLSIAAQKLGKTHEVILMIDLGDLREGVLPKDVIYTTEEILKLSNIKFAGIGTNLTCYGGIIPDKNNLGKLVEIKELIEEQLKIEVPIVSGGNSSSLYMVLNDSIPKGINQLRIGEAVVLGTEAAFEKDIKNFYNHAFILKGEIIELKKKTSLPKGRVGVDAFGDTPSFEDKGVMTRAIIALGKQDICLEGLYVRDEDIDILGASSDHLLLDLTNCKKDYKVGDIVEFNMDYPCLLATMTSPYVMKYFLK